MIFKRVFYPILAIAIVVSGFSLWKMSSKDTPEVKEIYRTATSTTSTQPSPTASKVQIDDNTPHADATDTLPTVMDVMDPNLPISHPKNVEARHKLTVARFKSWQTSEQLADPRIKKFLEVMESEAYLELVKSGATFDELTNFMADKGLGVPRNPTQVMFRRFFPTGDPADYEPEMRTKLSALIVESGGDSSQVISEFIEDERNRIWFLGYFGSRVNQRDMNLDHIDNWVKDVSRNAMSEAEASVSTPVEISPRFEDSTVTPGINIPADTQSPQEQFTRDALHTSKEKDLERGEDITTKLIEQLKRSEFNLPTEENIETALRAQFSPKRLNKAMQTLSQYGTEEGIRRLKISDPELAKRIQPLIRKQREAN